MSVMFHTEDIRFSLLGRKRDLATWMRMAANEEGFRIGDVNIIFCSDDYLLKINRAYLRHDYLTDIITFDYSDPRVRVLSGDLFISVDRVRENSERYETVFHVELLRVIVHGIMHLTGYKDKTKAEREVMRKKEDHCLGKLSERLKAWG